MVPRFEAISGLRRPAPGVVPLCGETDSQVFLARTHLRRIRNAWNNGRTVWTRCRNIRAKGSLQWVCPRSPASTTTTAPLPSAGCRREGGFASISRDAIVALIHDVKVSLPHPEQDCSSDSPSPCLPERRRPQSRILSIPTILSRIPPVCTRSIRNSYRPGLTK